MRDSRGREDCASRVACIVHSGKIERAMPCRAMGFMKSLVQIKLTYRNRPPLSSSSSVNHSIIRWRLDIPSKKRIMMYKEQNKPIAFWTINSLSWYFETGSLIKEKKRRGLENIESVSSSMLFMKSANICRILFVSSSVEYI